MANKTTRICSHYYVFLFLLFIKCYEAQGSVNLNHFIKQSLNSHNFYRAKHGVSPLRLSARLNQYAQNYANKLARSDRGLVHSSGPYGENLYYAWSTAPGFAPSGNKAVDSWYNEIHGYNFGREPTSLATGHFTQVIWKNSRNLGVGIAKSRKGVFYVVAEYDPPGNWRGQYRNNVFPRQ